MEAHHDARLGRVETEVEGMRSDITGIKTQVSAVTADVKAFGGILSRIETGVLRSQERSEERQDANKPNLTAIVSVLITIISILVGGAWLISGQLARQDASIALADQTSRQLVAERDREIDDLRARISKGEDRLWSVNRGGSTAPAN